MSVSNGEVSYSESLVYGGYPVNTTASFACDYEYALSGSESSICEASGTWNEHDQKCRKGKVEGMQRKKFKVKVLTVTKLKMVHNLNEQNSNNPIEYSQYYRRMN